MFGTRIQEHMTSEMPVFLLRVREEKKDEYNITLKNRHPDRDSAAYGDFSKPLQQGDMILNKFKFEEDIMPKFTSKYSSSADFKTGQMPMLNTFNDVLLLSPLLNNLNIPPAEILIKVNNFEVKEISYDLGTIKFDESKDKVRQT